MNKSLLLSALTFMVLCGCSKSQDSFTINGTVNGQLADSALVWLERYDDGQQVIIDSAVVSGNKFTLKGALDLPELCALVIDQNAPGEKDYQNKRYRCRFYVENSDINFVGHTDSMPAYYYNPSRPGVFTVTGSKAEDENRQLAALLSPISNQIKELDNRMSLEYLIPSFDGIDATDAGIEIASEMEAMNRLVKEAKLDFIRNNPGTRIAFDEVSYAIDGYSFPLTSSEIDSLIEVIRPAWQGKPIYDDLVSRAALARRLAIGQPYCDINVINTDGETVKLSSVMPQGKYVLLEFWASWCGPCRAEIPHLKHVAEKYPDFKIVSVSVDEKDDEWRKAMADEGMSWTQLRAPNGFEGELQEVYNITGVPTCLLIDPDGNFVGTDMRGAYLDNFLANQY